MKINVIMPTYNSSKYIKDQIESILNQTYNDFELIISDDKSTDYTIDILNSYVSKDSRIKLFQQEQNLGYTKNFEFLLKEADGDIIFFSDHDDIWLENKIELSIQKILETNTDLVYTDLTLVDSNLNVMSKSYNKLMGIVPIEGKSDYLFHTNICAGCTMGITKKIRDLMIPFKENVEFHDWLAAFIASQENGLTYVNQPTILYRQHGTNYMGGQSIFSHLKRFSKENGTKYENYVHFRKFLIEFKYISGIKVNINYYDSAKFRDIEKYFLELLNIRYLDLRFLNYFKYFKKDLSLKRTIITLTLFHFPVIGYPAYLLAYYLK